MIKNFEEVKKQLEELSSVINAFKSEAVQLRIIDLIFKSAQESSALDNVSQSKTRSSSTRRKKAKAKPESSSTGKDQKGKAGKNKTGATTVLEQLINDGFFDKKHTIKQISDHCRSKKAVTFKVNELTTPLIRFVRNKKLEREKNSDGQYEYWKV